MIFVMRDGQRHGPYSRDELIDALKNRKVSLNDFAWHDGDSEMQTVSEFLANASASPPVSVDKVDAPAYANQATGIASTVSSASDRTDPTAVEIPRPWSRLLAQWIFAGVALLIVAAFSVKIVTNVKQRVSDITDSRTALEIPPTTVPISPAVLPSASELTQPAVKEESSMTRENQGIDHSEHLPTPPPVVNATPAPSVAIATPAPPSPSPSLAELTKLCSNYLAIVQGDASAGSACIVKIKGVPLIVSNAHVPSGNRTVNIRLLNSQDLVPERLGIANDRDLLVASQSQIHDGLEASTSVDKDVTIGDEVVVLGNSLGSRVVTQLTGKVLGIGPDLIEIDANFVHGNSGSPIIHLKTGRVIGIATYLIPRNKDATTQDTRFKEARRLGVRIDTVSKWYFLTPTAYLQEGLDIAEIHKRTVELAILAAELHAGKRVNALQYDPNGWLRRFANLLAHGWPQPTDYAYQITSISYMNSEQEFKTHMDDDVVETSRTTLSPYHSARFQEEAEYRKPISQYLRSLYWQRLAPSPETR